MNYLIDDIMYIVDGLNPFRQGYLYGKGGLGYVPTKYNMVGGTLGSAKTGYREYTNDELENMNKKELLDIYEEDQEYLDGYDDLSEYEKELNRENLKLHNDEKLKVLKMLKENYPEDYEEMSEENNELELNEYLENFDKLNLEELQKLSYLINEMYIDGDIDDKKEEEISDKIRQKEQELLRYSKFDDIIHYTLKKEKGKDIESKLITGTKDDEEEYYEGELLKDEYTRPNNYEFTPIIELRKIVLDENEKPDYIEIGNIIEGQFINHQEIFKSISSDNSNVNNSKNENSPYYTQNMKKIANDVINLAGKPAKLKDAYIVDFIGEKTLYEMKCYKNSFADFYKKGDIHLKETKINFNKDFELKFIEEQNKIKVDNIIYRKEYKKTLSGSKYDYYTMFILSDGGYYCDMTDKELYVYNNILKKYEFKYKKDKNGEVHIPIKYIKRIDEKLMNKIK